ncbi:beta-ketoacyl-ACP reductase [Rathayibacter rathayi]|uniref:SDR family NAD(P)-dependent oxidoreductase n=1 Tax=Rathayibacter rathayi TaxID=33887 RepID=UPI000CE80321|nr:SDR family oxidoreductase [Rathayibacter rathayi]PPG65138.1 beta-ketoacyl-ACP reductase [Rathayibacter rathayi]PPG74178.1 beta-ketoacyl-ACP reductase [Rathayibacter rathayi]PPH16906.1 beta-ketoacyl-ACP reductase [Rathayibacter rathayi]
MQKGADSTRAKAPFGFRVRDRACGRVADRDNQAEGALFADGRQDVRYFGHAEPISRCEKCVQHTRYPANTLSSRVHPAEVNVKKLAVVFGASRGIGAATARCYLANGFEVVGTHRGSGPPEGVQGVEADVRDQASVRTVFRHARAMSVETTLDTVVVNAGIVRQDLLVRMRDEDLREVFETNTFGAFNVVRAAVREMNRLGGGSIVLVASESARAGIPGGSHYTASKAALEGLARSAMWEYGSVGIRFNVVSPGATETDMFSLVSKENRAAHVARTPLGRIGRPEEIASVIYWVSQSTYMTGATIPVTGGEGLGL